MTATQTTHQGTTPTPLAVLRAAEARIRQRYAGDKTYVRKLTAPLARVRRADDVDAAIEAHRCFRRFAMSELYHEGQIEPWLPPILDALTEMIASAGLPFFVGGLWWEEYPMGGTQATGRRPAALAEVAARR